MTPFERAATLIGTLSLLLQLMGTVYDWRSPAHHTQPVPTATQAHR